MSYYHTYSFSLLRLSTSPFSFLPPFLLFLLPPSPFYIHLIFFFFLPSLCSSFTLIHSPFSLICPPSPSYVLLLPHMSSFSHLLSPFYIPHLLSPFFLLRLLSPIFCLPFSSTFPFFRILSSFSFPSYVPLLPSSVYLFPSLLYSLCLHPYPFSLLPPILYISLLSTPFSFSSCSLLPPTSPFSLFPSTFSLPFLLSLLFPSFLRSTSKCYFRCQWTTFHTCFRFFSNGKFAPHFKSSTQIPLELWIRIN